MKKYWALATAVAAVGGCGRVSASRELDVVGPGNGRVWQANVRLSTELREILISFGYTPGNNCMQRVKNIKQNGESTVTLELFVGRCSDFLMQGTPLAAFVLESDPANGNMPWLWHAKTRVGYFDTAAQAVSTLCTGAYAKSCSLTIDEVGVLTGFASSGKYPIMPYAVPAPGSADGKKLTDFVNVCINRGYNCFSDFFNRFSVNDEMWQHMENSSLFSPHPARPFSGWDELRQLRASEMDKILELAEEYNQLPRVRAREEKKAAGSPTSW